MLDEKSLIAIINNHYLQLQRAHYMNAKIKEKISAAFLQLAQAYWESIDETQRGTGLTPPLKLTTLVTDDTGKGRDTQIKIEIERVNITDSPAGGVANG